MLPLSIAAATPTAQGNPFMSFLPFLLMIAIIWFLMIRPQQKRQKELMKMLDNLQVNDRVVTSSGIVGRIANIKADKGTVMLEVDENNHFRMEFQKSAIVGILGKNEQEN